MAFIKEGTD